MDKEQLKKKLHQYIDELEDEAALNMLHEAAVEYNKVESKEREDDLSPEQLLRLEESLKQLDNGDWIDHEDVRKMARSWVRK